MAAIIIGVPVKTAAPTKPSWLQRLKNWLQAKREAFRAFRSDTKIVARQIATERSLKADMRTSKFRRAAASVKLTLDRIFTSTVFELAMIFMVNFVVWFSVTFVMVLLLGDLGLLLVLLGYLGYLYWTMAHRPKAFVFA